MKRFSHALIPLAALVICLSYLSFSEGFIGMSPFFGAPTPPPHLHGKTCYVTWSKEKGYDIKVSDTGIVPINCCTKYTCSIFSLGFWR